VEVGGPPGEVGNGGGDRRASLRGARLGREVCPRYTNRTRETKQRPSGSAILRAEKGPVYSDQMGSRGERGRPHSHLCASLSFFFLVFFLTFCPSASAGTRPSSRARACARGSAWPSSPISRQGSPRGHAPHQARDRHPHAPRVSALFNTLLSEGCTVHHSRL